MAHDFDKQKADSFGVWADIQKRNEHNPREITLDLQFVPIKNDAGAQPLKIALESLGYSVSFYEDDDTLEVTVQGVVNSADEIWRHEERATKLALPLGYTPDGWGFFSN